MSILGRAFALIGLILVIAGVLVPVLCADATCEPIENALFDPDRFEDEDDISQAFGIISENALFDPDRFEGEGDISRDFGILSNLHGLLLIVVAVPALVAIFAGNRGSIVVSALTITIVTAVVFVVFFLRTDDNQPIVAAGIGDLSLGWGWIVLFLGCSFLLLSTVMVAAVVVEEPAALPPQQPIAHQPGYGPAHQFKTEVLHPSEVRAAMNADSNMDKTMIEGGGQPGHGAHDATMIEGAPPQQGDMHLGKTQVGGMPAPVTPPSDNMDKTQVQSPSEVEAMQSGQSAADIEKTQAQNPNEIAAMRGAPSGDDIEKTQVQSPDELARMQSRYQMEGNEPTNQVAQQEDVGTHDTPQTPPSSDDDMFKTQISSPQAPRVSLGDIQDIERTQLYFDTDDNDEEDEA